MCKPDMTIDASAAKTDETFQQWSKCIQDLSSFDNVYMKLSGGFSELSKFRVFASDPKDLVGMMRPWLECVFESFGPGQIMFGSDWPVCNVRGPAVEKSWTVWTDTVKCAMDDFDLSEAQKVRVWKETAIEAYRLR